MPFVLNRTVWKKTIISTLRIYLALIFLIYGLAKFNGQFHHGHFVFDSAKNSGQELVWGFFGYSTAYVCFIAFGEIISAILLLIPRLATLGAMMLLPITTNITFIDYAYHVDRAKHFSLMLTIMNVILLLFDYKKLKLLFLTPEQLETLLKKGEKNDHFYCWIVDRGICSLPAIPCFSGRK